MKKRRPMRRSKPRRFQWLHQWKGAARRFQRRQTLRTRVLRIPALVPETPLDRSVTRKVPKGEPK